ncbi:hypothetical protein [Vibrio harveyi]|uniref:capsular polysaccharide export protein, LipB/KpsS family n=1 Tax=Vibrio harveyi TaxID=669 RepID=UPI002B3ADDFA|nr:hypothetical protein [Vibrio harveyi]HEQ3594969.1 hypothetical protein [Vibrio harveyi]HEQ3606890.1 hypothetical protein [Vibrio harveyi]
MNVLSLDPMYSSLHCKIAEEYHGKKFAILTSLGLKHYLPGFEFYYIERLIQSKRIIISQTDLDVVKSMDSHFSALARKVEKRELADDELEYMAKFYVFLKQFVVDNNIKVVLLHNDLRWQHSIAVFVCRELAINYLVTEQGLFRPHTTVVDSFGVNAYSNVKNEYQAFLDKGEDLNRYITNDIITSSHDSWYSYANFFRYLIFSKIGKFLGTEARIVHKRHTFTEYVKRFYYHRINPLLSGKTPSSSDGVFGNGKKAVFVPLQLELDTQLLIHSDFSSNQEVISLIEIAFYEAGLCDKYDLVFKKHPNDQQEYNFSNFSKLTNVAITTEFLQNVSLVISVNSSALLQVLSTPTPVITLGRSIYDVPGVAFHSNGKNLALDIKSQLDTVVDVERRYHYVDYLKLVYSIQGAGNSFSKSQIDKIMNKLTRN